MKRLKMLSVAKKARLIFPLLFILLINSCKKSESLNPGISETTLTELQNWYANQKNNSKLGSLSGLLPMWAKIKTSEQTTEVIYEVELSNPNHVFTAKQVLDKKNLTEYEMRSLFKLVFTKEKVTGTIHAAYMNIVADNGKQDIQAVRYKNATGFSGIVQYYNLNGSFNIGWHYTNGKIDMKYTAFNRLGKGVHTEAIVPCGTTPRYATFCFELEGGGQSCESRVIGYDQKLCFVMSDNPVNGEGDEGSFEPGGPEDPTDNSKGKNFGVDPDCLNCKVPIGDKKEFLAYVRGTGLTVEDPSHTTLTAETGESYEGMVTVIKDSDGKIVATYFEPDASSTKLELGYIYKIGNGVPNSGDNSSSTPGPLYIGTGGQIVGFESQFPDSGGGYTYTPDYSLHYSDAEMIDLINTLQDPITGNGIELYLIAKYKGSKTIDLSGYSTSNLIEVGNYSLTPYYSRSGQLLFYLASRLGQPFNFKNGVEYLIKADQLNNFRSNVNYYTSAANWFYANGIPSQSMIKYIAGPTFSDKFDGLLNLWEESLKSPDYWAYLISCFVTEGNNPKVRAAVNDVLPEGAAYTKSSLEIGQRIHAQYKLADVKPNIAIKEYRLPSGRRIDFLDIENATIYELKPNNPRQITAGKKQLQMYLDELKDPNTIAGNPRLRNITWKTKLDLY